MHHHLHLMHPGPPVGSRSFRIYKGRNFMKLLGYHTPEEFLEIYKSRNFMKLLGVTRSLNLIVYLQE